jgi:hypothetical protein
MGISLLNEQLDNNGQIDISSLPAGIYTVTVVAPNGKKYNTSIIKI